MILESTDKQWNKEFKVIYLQNFKDIESLDRIISKSWFSLIIIVSGGLIFMQGSSSVSLSAGDFYAVPNGAVPSSLFAPLRICMLSSTLDFAITGRIVRFSGEYMNWVANPDSVVLHLTPTELRYIISLFSLLKKKLSVEHTAFKDEIVLLCFNMVVYEYLDMCYKHGKNVEPVHYREKIVIRFVKMVQYHCRAHHDVKFYADSLYVSKGHLGKLVRTVLGFSAKYFIEMAVISEAYQLLEDYSLSITTVAEELHFDSCSSFSVFFKKHSKLTPTQYRLSLKH